MYCKRVRADDAYWEKIERYVARHAAVSFSHGICPTCMDERFGTLAPPAAGAEPATPSAGPPPDPRARAAEADVEELLRLIDDPALRDAPTGPALRQAAERCARAIARYRKAVEISDGYQEASQERLARALRHDPLTGLATRATAIVALEEALDRHRRGEPAPTLLLLEVGGLRAVNARHGYDVGDRVLVALSRTVRIAAPNALLRARWHGTAFAALLGADDRAGAAEELVRAVRAVVVTDGAHVIQLPIRAGAARAEAAGSAAAWVARAEEAARADGAAAGTA
jgi:diguanylate cyclase (GGDEF)-like protein